MHCFPDFGVYKIHKEKIINVPNCLGISGDTHTHTNKNYRTHLSLSVSLYLNNYERKKEIKKLLHFANIRNVVLSNC